MSEQRATTETPRPAGKPGMFFEWHDLLFLHWPVAADALRPKIPRELEIDTFDNHAWVGLVPFTMHNVRHRISPPIPTMHHFPECNVRTYVSHKGEPGVWFFSLDAASRLAVWGARTFWNLNYVHSIIHSERHGDKVVYSVQRRAEPNVTMNCEWLVGSLLPPSKPGEHLHFLTERYCLYSVDRRDRIMRGRIWHKPWRLREAELVELEDHLLTANGVHVEPDYRPLAHHASRTSVDVWKLERV